MTCTTYGNCWAKVANVIVDPKTVLGRDESAALLVVDESAALLAADERVSLLVVVKC